jgi:hypothetical protein
MGFTYPGRGPRGVKGVLEAIPVANHWFEALKLARGARAICHSWLASYGGEKDREAFDKFRRDWICLRVGIALQVRLMVEQLLYERGEPWSSLCTGFGPAKLA